MRLAHLALLFACFALPMYFMGYPSPMVQIMTAQGNAPLDFIAVLQRLAQNMTNATTALNILVLAAGITLFTGFSAVYIIPTLILATMINLVLIPSSYFVSGTCAPGALFCLPSLITTFLNLLIVLAFLEYATGGR